MGYWDVSRRYGVQTVLFLAGLVFAVSAEGAELVVTEQGVPRSRIVIENDPPVSVVYAAEELQGYLEKISGAKISIVKEAQKGSVSERQGGIYLGDTTVAQEYGIGVSGLKPDGFKITIPTDGILVIRGRDYKGPPLPGRSGRVKRNVTPDGKVRRFGQTGTLNGVYRLLRELGVRWYLPGDLGEVIPDRESISFRDLGISDAPHFHYRNLYAFWFNKDPQAARWWKRVGYGAEYYVNLNHSYVRWAQKYGEQHPEWFGKIRGKYDNKPRRGRNVVDFSNPEVLEATTKEAVDFFENPPPWEGVPESRYKARYDRYFPIFPVVPNDSFVNPGEAALRKGLITPERGEYGKFSDYVWGFVNDVAKSIQKKFPQRYIGGLAYSRFSLPPLKIGKLADNVVVMICKKRLHSWDQEYKKEILRESVLGWKSLEPARIYLWEYYNTATNKPEMVGVPVVAPHMISEDIKFLKDISHGEFVQAESQPGFDEDRRLHGVALSHINLYVTARLLWNPDIDVDSLMDEYYRTFYGPAEDPMREFFTLLEERWEAPDCHNGPPWQDLFPEQVRDQLFSFLDAALQKTPAGSIYRRRVEFMRDGFEIMQVQSAIKSEWSAPPELLCKETAGSPEIDGVLADKFWEERVKQKQKFVLSDTGQKAERNSWFIVGRDKEKLYIGVNVDLVPGEQLKQEVKERDGRVWLDDSIEMFVSPGKKPEKGQYYHFVINSKGVVSDWSPGEEIEWNSDINVKTKVDASGWQMEISLPLQELNEVLPTVGETWLFNIMYNRWGDRNKAIYYAWSPAFGNFHKPERFGYLVFADAEGNKGLLYRQSFDSAKPRIIVQKGDNTAVEFIEDGGSLNAQGGVVCFERKQQTGGIVGIRTPFIENISPNTIYRAKARVKLEGVVGEWKRNREGLIFSVHVHATDGSDGNYHLDYIKRPAVSERLRGSTDWREKEIVFKTGPKAKRAQINVFLTPNTAGKVMVDWIELGK